MPLVREMQGVGKCCSMRDITGNFVRQVLPLVLLQVALSYAGDVTKGDKLHHRQTYIYSLINSRQSKK